MLYQCKRGHAAWPPKQPVSRVSTLQSRPRLQSKHGLRTSCSPCGNCNALKAARRHCRTGLHLERMPCSSCSLEVDQDSLLLLTSESSDHAQCAAAQGSMISPDSRLCNQRSEPTQCYPALGCATVCVMRQSFAGCADNENSASCCGPCSALGGGRNCTANQQDQTSSVIGQAAGEARLMRQGLARPTQRQAGPDCKTRQGAAQVLSDRRRCLRAVTSLASEANQPSAEKSHYPACSGELECSQAGG